MISAAMLTAVSSVSGPQIEADRPRQPGQLGVCQPGGVQALEAPRWVFREPIAPTYPSRGVARPRREPVRVELGRG